VSAEDRAGREDERGGQHALDLGLQRLDASALFDARVLLVDVRRPAESRLKK
jgi:hypothetical protein